MRVVLDTNVWYSALTTKRPFALPRLALGRASRLHILLLAPELEAELKRVLPARSNYARYLRGAAWVSLPGNVRVCRDPRDDMFLECALVGKADFLVTGDKDLLVLKQFHDTLIVTPAQYLEVQ